MCIRARSKVAIDLSLFRHDGPEEWHQGCATFFCRIAPVGLLERCDILWLYLAVLFVHDRLIGTIEHFLPAQAIGHHVYNVLRPGWRHLCPCGYGRATNQESQGKRSEMNHSSYLI